MILKRENKEDDLRQKLTEATRILKRISNFEDNRESTSLVETGNLINS